MIESDILSFYREISKERVLVLVNTTVDGLCAWKILQSLLHIDNVQYTLIPVDGRTHLENAFRTHSDQNTTVLLLDCGGNVNISEWLEPLPDSQIFVLDSHLPIDLDNIYDGDVVKMVISEDLDIQVPSYEDIYEEDSDEEEGPERKRRREEDEDGEDSLIPRKERWRRKREDLLYNYYELAGCGVSVSHVIYELAWKLSRDSLQCLWWAVVGMTDQLMCGRVSREQYVNTYASLEQHVQRHNTRGSDGAVVSVNEMKIRNTNELRLELYRHWTLMESLKFSPYTATRFRIWTTKGKKKLNEFLADMGLPLLQCNQTFGTMDMEIRRDVCNWIQVTAQKYGLEDISYSSFELQYGYRSKFCAADSFNAVFTALTDPTQDTEAAFLRAQDTLNRHNEKLISTGIENSKVLCCGLLNQVQAFIDMKQVVVTGPFVYAVIQEGSAELQLFSHPARLHRLCRYLREAYCAISKKAAALPFIIAAPLHLDPDYSCVVGVPALMTESNKSYLGRAFSQAADKVNATVVFDDFDSSVIQIKTEDKAKFFDALTVLLMT